MQPLDNTSYTQQREEVNKGIENVILPKRIDFGLWCGRTHVVNSPFPTKEKEDQDVPSICK